MVKKADYAPAKAPPSPPQPPVTLHKATLGARGKVVKGALLSDQEAIVERRAGRDVVVCGPDLAENRRQAEAIEQAANGSYVRCPPHYSAGQRALPHVHPLTRFPAAHTFYETDNRKAAKR